MSNKRLFIVWYSHSRRAETLSREVNAQLVFLDELSFKKRWFKPLHYLALGWKTWRLLERERPVLVIVQSPPIFAPLTVALWCKLRRKKRTTYVIDCHPGTFYDSNWQWALPALRWLSRSAITTTLCNEDTQYILKQWDMKCLFLPDGLPTMEHASGTIGSEGEARIAVISTYSLDEPIAEIFEAARQLPQVIFYVTGDPQRASSKLLARKPDNVVLTGFLRGGAYSGLLHNVHGIIVLTNTLNSLTCGAYEALSLVKPTIVSDTPEMRRCFPHGFIFIENTPEAIAESVELLLSKQEMLTAEVMNLRDDFSARRQPKLEEYVRLLG
jgi:glycosyltransferase involved in cell wall biosynthesis